MAGTTFTIDASQAFQQFDAIERRLGDLNASAKKAAEATKNVFSPGGNLARQEVAALDQVQREYNDLSRAVTVLKGNLKNAWDPRAVTTYTKAIAEAEAELKRLDTGAKAVGVDLNKALTPPKQTGGGFGAGLLSQFAPAALATGAAVGFGAAIKEGIALNVEYEKIKTSLNVILKDSGKADILLGKLNKFAAETPFQSDDINRAATQLLAFGESELTVIDRLREIGTISAATGKDFNELATIYGKARVAGVLYAEDINQLVEAGVPIIGEFAKQLGVSESQVKKLAGQGKVGFEQLQTAFSNLTSEGGRFSGLLEAQSQTLGGQLSTIRDNAAQVLRLGTNYLGVTRLVQGLTSRFSELAAFFVGKLQPAQKTQIDQTRDIQAEFNLEVEALKKSNFTQAERAKAIGEINTKYKEYLPNLIDEKASIDDITAAQKLANNQFEQKILFLAFEEAYKAELDKSKQAITSAYNAEKQRGLLQEKLRRDGSQDNARFEDFQKGQINFFETIREESLKTAEQAPENIAAVEKTFDGFAERLGTSLSAIKKKFKEAGEIKPTAGAPIDDKEAKRRLAEAEKIAATIEKIQAAITPDGLDNELAQVNKKYDGLIKATEEGVAQLQAIERQRGLSPEQRAQLEELATFSVQLEERRLSELTAVLLDFNEKEQAIRDEQIKRQQALIAKGVEGQKQALEEQKAIRDAEIKLQEERGAKLVLIAKKNGADEKDVAELQRQFDLATQKARLESELKFQEGLLAIIGSGNEQQAAEIKRTIAQIKAELGTLDIKIETPDVKGGGKKSIWDVLGIDTSTDAGKDFADQAEAMAKRVIDSFQNLAAERTALAEQEVSDSDDRISQLEGELDREIQLAELGFASDVTLKRKELEQEKVKNEQLRAEAEKAKRSQLAIDTAIQASSLVTSIANLFKSLSAVPFGLGIPIAIALSGAMLAFFIKSKVNAYSAAKARYGTSGSIDKQGIVHGQYHEHGGHLLEVEKGEMVQVGQDGSRKRIEVVRRERVREYMDLLSAANKGDRKSLAIQALKLADVESLPASVKKQIIGSNSGDNTTYKESQTAILREYVTDSTALTTVEQNNAIERSREIIFSAAIAEIQKLTPAIQQEVLQQFQSIVFDNSRAVQYQTTGPTVNQRKVTNRVFGKGDSAVTVRIDGNDSKRTNELLERLILLQIEQSKAEKWSPDGKTKIRGGTKTRYLN
jgi:tape measure domain-containing protein